MSAPPVPTLRAAHFVPYLDYLQDKGVSTEKSLKKFRLPTALDPQPEARLPAIPILKFLSYIERNERVHDIGILASRYVHLGLLSPTNQNAILSSPTLEKALEAFILGVKLESSAVVGWTTLEGSVCNICKQHAFASNDDEDRPMQIHFVLLALSVIRAFAGPGWMPAVMGFRSRVPLSPLVGNLFPHTRFFFGQTHSWISLPEEMLALQKVPRRASAIRVLERKDQVNANTLIADDFVSSLKHILKAYLSDGYPSIDLAAEVSGTSVRTLQRILAQSNTTYSKLVEQARVEAAVELLGDTDNKIIDIAYAVGYEDPSHFSRAFRRLTGASPREYRLSGAA